MLFNYYKCVVTDPGTPPPLEVGLLLSRGWGLGAGGWGLGAKEAGVDHRGLELEASGVMCERLTVCPPQGTVDLPPPPQAFEGADALMGEYSDRGMGEGGRAMRWCKRCERGTHQPMWQLMWQLQGC